MILEIANQEKRVHKFFDVNYEYNLKPSEYIETVVVCCLKQNMSQGSFNCSQCGQSFNSQQELERHNQQHQQQQS